MTLLETFEESISVLKTNKMRTALSALGIIIGIGSVISLVSLGQSSQLSVKQKIQSLGANLLMVRPGSSSEGGFLRGGAGTATTLTNEDAEAISVSTRFTTIDKVASEYSSQSQVSFGANNTRASISGVTLYYFSLRNIKISRGEYFTDEDMLFEKKNAVISSSLAETLFTNNEDPINEKIRINGNAFSIIGVTESSGTGFNNSDIVYVPLPVAQKLIFGVDHLSTIYIGAKDENLMDAAENQIGYFLLERHGLLEPGQADFSIMSQGDILETANEVTETFTTLLSGIAAISLIVGGIGIMNIMLVTVTERTREIGIRKSLGAKNKMIIRQFLIEALILTVFGGILGVMLGLVLTFALTKVMDLPFVFSPHSVVLAVLVSCAVGIIFGWYPARKASKLQPIEALRYE